ncbi:MAG: hypothetical protein LAT52_04900 [Balneolales bacterium]|nr:hypothetical protein [Balneolales bacterium]
MRFAASLTLIFVFAQISIGQTVRTFVTPDSLTTGSTFNYIITAQYASNQYSPVFPDSTAFSDAIEFRSVQRFRGVSSRDSVVYELQFFALNDTIIGPKEVTFNSSEGSVSVNTSSVNLYFVSLLDETSAELRDLKPLFLFGRSWFWLMLFLIAVFITAILLYRYRSKFVKKEPIQETPKQEIPPFVSPFDTLFREINELRNIQIYSDDNFRGFYTKLSDAFRLYFEDVYFIPALESTTREVIRDVQRKGVDDCVVLLLNNLLKESDMVKFAKYRATEDQALKALNVAEQLVKLVQRADYDRISQLRISYQAKYGLREGYHKTSIQSDNAMLEGNL